MHCKSSASMQNPISAANYGDPAQTCNMHLTGQVNLYSYATPHSPLPLDPLILADAMAAALLECAGCAGCLLSLLLLLVNAAVSHGIHRAAS